MKVRRFYLAQCNAIVTTIEHTHVSIAIPDEVPLEVIMLVWKRFRDYERRPLAWKRRESRRAVREQIRLMRGRSHVKRHVQARRPAVPRRYERRLLRRRWSTPAYTRV